jgi:3-methyladenine DNA glycosylase AlkD
MEMTAQELFADIRQYCEIHADPQIVKKYSRYFKEGYDAYGLSSELLTSKTSSLIKNQKVTFELVTETSNYLIRTGKYEETSFAYTLMKEFTSQFSYDTFWVISDWFDNGIINWAHTDIICGDLIAYLLKKFIIRLEDLSPWRRSERKYKRRAVPVSMLSLLPLRDDYSGLFRFIDPMMTDSERVVHQGLGWLLREAWKKKPVETEAFLRKWKNDAPRLIFQYATEKMDKEQKPRFRKEK